MSRGNWSLASRLTLWYTLATILLLFGSTLALYISLKRALDIEDSLFLLDKAQAVVSLLRDGGTAHASIRERVEKEWAARKFERVYVQVLGGDGKPITESPGFSQLPRELFDEIEVIELGQRARAAKRYETRSGRLFKVQILRARDQTIKIAIDRTDEENFLARYRGAIGLILGLALIISALVGRRIALRGIRPVRDIVAAMNRIRSTTLHERIKASDVPLELQTLASTFNEMLDRLNEAFDRLSRFSADIAHDLRTPLNNLRGEIEVALGRARSPEEYQEVLGSCLEESTRVTSLIDNLLFLSRAENPHEQLATEVLDLDLELERVREFYEASALDRRQALELEVERGLRLRADRALLQRALGNLISNAISYTPEGGKIRIVAGSTGQSVNISVRDTGIGIAAEHLPRVFERFYRVDLARSTHSGGTGLGLSIVKSIAALHHGRVDIASEPGRGTTVTLTLPCA